MTWTTLTLLLGLSLLKSPATAQKQASGLCLDPSLVQQAAKSNGITNPANPDKFAKSLISSNNFIDLCHGATLTNGAQVQQGSCNPTPMGFIPSVSNMPSVRIIQPEADKVIPPNTDIEVVIKVAKMRFGSFTSPTNTYYLAPQQLNKKGLIKGHVHVVIQPVHGKEIIPADQVSAFKGISDKPVNGKLNVTFTGGLPPGFYRISTITSAKNHQPALLPVARRGAVDDAIYVHVGTAGGSSSNATKNGDTAQSVGEPSGKAKGHKRNSKK